MDTKKILTYLTDLSQNNNREWYHAHKAENKAANAQFLELVQALILGPQGTDLQAGAGYPVQP